MVNKFNHIQTIELSINFQSPPTLTKIHCSKPTQKAIFRWRRLLLSFPNESHLLSNAVAYSNANSYAYTNAYSCSAAYSDWRSEFFVYTESSISNLKLSIKNLIFLGVTKELNTECLYHLKAQTPYFLFKDLYQASINF